VISNGCSENESTRVELNLCDREHCKLKLLLYLKSGSSDTFTLRVLEEKKEEEDGNETPVARGTRVID